MRSNLLSVLTTFAALSCVSALAEETKYGKVEVFHPKGSGFAITNYVSGADTLSVVSNETIYVLRVPTQHSGHVHVASSTTANADKLTVTADTAFVQGGTLWCCWTVEKCKASECFFDVQYPDDGCKYGGAGCAETALHCTGGWTACPAGTWPDDPNYKVLQIGSPLP